MNKSSNWNLHSNKEEIYELRTIVKQIVEFAGGKGVFAPSTTDGHRENGEPTKGCSKIWTVYGFYGASCNFFSLVYDTYFYSNDT